MAEQGTTTVRVSIALHERMKALAEQQGTTITQVVADAVKELERKRFWEEYRVAYERLQADPEAYADYLREMREWDNAMASDGLEPEKWTDADFITPSQDLEPAESR